MTARATDAMVGAAVKALMARGMNMSEAIEVVDAVLEPALAAEPEVRVLHASAGPHAPTEAQVKAAHRALHGEPPEWVDYLQSRWTAWAMQHESMQRATEPDEPLGKHALAARSFRNCVADLREAANVKRKAAGDPAHPVVPAWVMFIIDEWASKAIQAMAEYRAAGDSEDSPHMEAARQQLILAKQLLDRAQLMAAPKAE
jgi:hypothetical protein